MATKSTNRQNQKPKTVKKVKQVDSGLKIKEKIQALNPSQEKFMRDFRSGKHIVAHGSAGTGKSILAVYLALEKLEAKEIDRIIIVRSAVSTRAIGFLPGSEADKYLPYTAPYRDIVNHLYDCGTAWDTLTKKEVITFITTSFVRGITFDNAVVILDEFQNADAPEITSVLTRIGLNTQVVLSGDTKQNDLFRSKEKSGGDFIINIAMKMKEWFSVIEFTSDDIVRSGFVKALIQAIEKDS